MIPTTIFDMIRAEDLQGAKAWLAEGNHPDRVCPEGVSCDTPLQAALRAGCVPLVALFLEAGASPHLTRKLEGMPMILAARLRDPIVRKTCVALLLKAGANPNVMVAGRNTCASSPLLEAASAPAPVEPTLKVLLNGGASPHGCGRYGGDLLYELASRGLNDDSLALIKTLLCEHRVDSFMTPDEDRSSTFERLAYSSKDQTQVLQWCLLARAEQLGLLAGQSPRQDDIDLRALWESSAGELLEKALKEAFESGHIENAKMLLAWSEGDGFRQPALLARVLHDTVTLEPYSQAKARTPLLLAAGANPALNQHGEAGDSALMKAISKERWSLLSTLLACPAVPNEVALDILVQMYFQHDSGYGNLQQNERLPPRGRVQPFGAGRMPGPAPKEDDWRDALPAERFWRRSAPPAANARRDLLHAVLGKGGDVNLADSAGHNTLLHHLAAYGAPSKDLKSLLDAGADPNAQNQDGRTPVMLALSHPKPPGKATLELLVNAGADLSLKDKRGVDAMTLARHYDNPGLLKLLTDLGAPAGEPAPTTARQAGPGPAPVKP